MDTYFDPNQFHPTFLSGNDPSLDATISGESIQYHSIMNDFMKSAHEHSMAPDVVRDAVNSAVDFFQSTGFSMTKLPIHDTPQTWVEANNPTTVLDDVMGFNRDEMLRMGINTKDSMSLIATHEMGHRLTQLMYASGQVSTWENELIADAWMGVRAEVDKIDIGSVYHSFDNATDSPTHPGSDLRHEFMNIGQQIAKDMKDHDIEITYDGVMARMHDYLTQYHDVITPREVAQQPHAIAQPVAFTGNYTQSEIDQHIHDAQDKIDYARSVIKEHTQIAKDRAAHGQPTDSEAYTIGSAKIDLENALKDKNRWENEKPMKNS